MDDFRVGWIVYRVRAAEDAAWATRRAQVATVLATQEEAKRQSGGRWAVAIPLASFGLFWLGTYTGFFT